MFGRDKFEDLSSALTAFLEKPSQDFKAEELNSDIKNVSLVLEKDPQGIFHLISNIINSDPYVQGSDLFADLIAKLNLAGRTDISESLLRNHADKIAASYIHNVFDLVACSKGLTNGREILVASVCQNEEVLSQIFEANASAPSYHKEITEPAIYNRLRIYYDQNYARKPQPK